MTWADAFRQLNRTVASRAELVVLGATSGGLASAVRTGQLLRLRRDHYSLPGVSNDIARAVRVGGRLGCVSALADAGVFVFDSPFPHICMPPLASRSRSPNNRFVPLSAANRDGAELHWVELFHAGGSEVAVDVRDALLQSLRCQTGWQSIASFDSALFQGLVSRAEVEQIFDLAPSRFRALAARLDGRAESGSESKLRLLIEDAGLSFEIQVKVPGVGRVDMIVEGCLVVEADSRIGHAGWERQRNDRARDLRLAQRNLMSLRPTSEHIFYSPMEVLNAITGALRVNRRYGTQIHNS
jgi:hypothetical protein